MKAVLVPHVGDDRDREARSSGCKEGQTEETSTCRCLLKIDVIAHIELRLVDRAAIAEDPISGVSFRFILGLFCVSV